jgi:hypothetical protein
MAPESDGRSKGSSMLPFPFRDSWLSNESSFSCFPPFLIRKSPREKETPAALPPRALHFLTLLRFRGCRLRANQPEKYGSNDPVTDQLEPRCFCQLSRLTTAAASVYGNCLPKKLNLCQIGGACLRRVHPSSFSLRPSAPAPKKVAFMRRIIAMRPEFYLWNWYALVRRTHK